MAEYHVGTSDITGTIYAGRARKHGNSLTWLAKDEVTNEAIDAVASHMLSKLDEGEHNCAYMLKTYDGRYLRLRLDILDHKPECFDKEEEDGGRPD